jgi:hypothetical protein
MELQGQRETVYHHNGTLFDHTFTVTTNTGSDFALTDYSGVFKIYTLTETLYTKSTGGTELVFSSNTFRVNDNISLTQYGKVYFDLTITHSTDAEKVYRIWFGSFINER